MNRFLGCSAHRIGPYDHFPNAPQFLKTSAAPYHTGHPYACSGCHRCCVTAYAEGPSYNQAATCAAASAAGHAGAGGASRARSTTSGENALGQGRPLLPTLSVSQLLLCPKANQSLCYANSLVQHCVLANTQRLQRSICACTLRGGLFKQGPYLCLGCGHLAAGVLCDVSSHTRFNHFLLEHAACQKASTKHSCNTPTLFFFFCFIIHWQAIAEMLHLHSVRIPPLSRGRFELAT